MENDDSRFYEPRKDFPMVSGDTGRFWNSEAEQRARTPSSERDLEEERENRALKSELSELENSQSERGIEMYSNYQHKFNSISEKIYFLKLPYSERHSYLESRGFVARPISDPSRVSRTRYQRANVRLNEVTMGMSKSDVAVSLGNPVRVEVAGNPSYENERWLYDLNGASKYIYFESGRVQGWE